MKKLSNYVEPIILILIVVALILWLNRPCMVKPLASRDCYCEGYKDATGEYPPQTQNKQHDHIE